MLNMHKAAYWNQPKHFCLYNDKTKKNWINHKRALNSGTIYSTILKEIEDNHIQKYSLKPQKNKNCGGEPPIHTK